MHVVSVEKLIYIGRPYDRNTMNGVQKTETAPKVSGLGFRESGNKNPLKK